MATGNTDMHISRAPRLEWNLNTLIQLVTLLSMVCGGIYIWVDARRDIEDLQGWRVNHEQLHRDRLAEVKEKEGAYNARLASIEKDADASERQADNIAYRVTVLEQNRDSLSKAFEELKASVQDIASEQKVSTEILQRLDRAFNKQAR